MKIPSLASSYQRNRVGSQALQRGLEGCGGGHGSKNMHPWYGCQGRER